MITDSDTWKYLFSKIRKTYFDQWNRSETVGEREQIYTKISVLKDLEQEFLDLENHHITSMNVKDLPRENNTYHYKY